MIQKAISNLSINLLPLCLFVTMAVDDCREINSIGYELCSCLSEMPAVLTHVFVAGGENTNISVVKQCLFKDVDVVVAPFAGPKIVEVNIFLVGLDGDIIITRFVPVFVDGPIAVTKGLCADTIDASSFYVAQ